MQPLSSNRLLNIALAVSLMAIAIILNLSFHQSKKIKESSARVDHTQQVIQQIQKEIIAALDMQVAAKGYEMTGRQSNVQQFTEVQKSMNASLLSLRTLLSDNSTQLALFDSLHLYLKRRAEISNELISLRQHDKTNEANALVASGIGKYYTDKIKKTGAAMTQIENDLLQKRKKVNDASIQNLNNTLYLVLTTVLVTSFLLFYKIKGNFKNQKANEKKIRALLDAAPDAMVITDGHGIIEMINRQTTHLFGYNPEELIGKKAEILIPEAFRQQHAAHMYHPPQVPSNTRDGEGTEMLALRKDGMVIPVEISLSHSSSSTGRIVSASIRDIRRRKKNQQQFELLLQQVNQSNDAIVTVDTELNITNWNFGAEQLYGYTKEEAIGKSSIELLPAEMTKEEKLRVKEKVNTEGYWTGEVKRFGKDKKEIWVISSITAVKNKEGKITGYISVSYDIHHQKALQLQIAHLANIVEHSSDAILSRGPDKRIMSWNEGAEKMFGYTKDEAIGKKAAEMGLVRFTSEENKEVDAELFVKGKWQAEKTYYCKNGDIVYGSVSGNSIKNSAGEMETEVFIVKDITLRKHMEDYLKTVNDTLEEKINERTEELYKTQQRFKAMIENSNDLISLIDVNKNIIYRTPAAERLTGKSNQEIKDIDSFKNLIHEDDQVKLKSLIEESIAKPGIPVQTSLRLLSKTGGYRLLEGHVTNFLQNQHIQAIVINSRDITETKEAEEKLAASEKRFRALIDKAHDVITLMDASFRMIYRSPSSERSSGWSNEEMMYKVATENMHPDDVEEARSIAMQALANPGVTYKSLFRNRHKDGHYIWLEGMLTNWLHDENVQAMVFNSQDVTERIEAAEKIAASEERFRNTLDNMIEGIQILDNNLQYLYVNEAVAKQAGQTREALTGNLFTDLYPGMEQTPLYQKMRYCVEMKVALQMENEFIFPDKTVKYFQLSFQPVPEGLLIMSVDITDKKKAENELMTSLHEKELLADKFSIILNRLPANIVLLDADGKIMEINDGWKGFVVSNGYTGTNYGIGENYIQVTENAFGEVEEQSKKIATGIKAVLNMQLEEFEFEHPCHCPDEKRWFRMIVSPLKHSSFTGVVIMHIDITELKRMEQERLHNKIEEQRNIARAMLQGQEKERNQIGRELHDNIVQLMAATKMKLGLFASQKGGQPTLLNQSMDHLQAALTETRNLSHQMVTPRFSVYTFRSELERLFADYANDHRKVHLNISAIDEAAVSIPLRETLYRIAQEHLNNVDKYASASQVHLELYVQEGHINMIISDNGSGFDLKQARKGIGLTNIYNRAESFAGTASIVSEPGRGCTLIIEIPLINTTEQ